MQSIVAAAEAAASEAAAAEMQQQAEASEAALESELDTLRTEQAAALREASAAIRARSGRQGFDVVETQCFAAQGLCQSQVSVLLL